VTGKALLYATPQLSGFPKRYRFGAGITRHPGETVMRGDEPRLFPFVTAFPDTDADKRYGETKV
jgi:hypothetical protein